MYVYYILVSSTRIPFRAQPQTLLSTDRLSLELWVHATRAAYMIYIEYMCISAGWRQRGKYLRLRDWRAWTKNCYNFPTVGARLAAPPLTSCYQINLGPLEMLIRRWCVLYMIMWHIWYIYIRIYLLKLRWDVTKYTISNRRFAAY